MVHTKYLSLYLSAMKLFLCYSSLLPIQIFDKYWHLIFLLYYKLPNFFSFYQSWLYYQCVWHIKVKKNKVFKWTLWIFLVNAWCKPSFKKAKPFSVWFHERKKLRALKWLSVLIFFGVENQFFLGVQEETSNIVVSKLLHKIKTKWSMWY